MARETKAQRAEREEITAQLKGMVERGQTVYCILRHVSRSGMMRHISLHITDKEGRLRDISYLASRAIGWPEAPGYGGIKVSGCGMNMGFHTVYTLSAVLFADDPRENSARNNLGGYALKSEWV